MKTSSKKQNSPSHVLPGKLIKTPKLLSELELLFDLAPPSSLKRSLTSLFFSYICNTETKNYKEDMKEICTDFYCLLKFLEIAETCEREHELKKMKN